MRMWIRKARNRMGLWPGPALGLALSVILLVFAGCEASKQNASIDNSANGADHPELFTIRPEQMSHIQVVTVQPTTLTRTLRLTGAVAYNGFRTTPVITQ